MNILALIPARKNSRGIPNKNWRRLGGRTLMSRAEDVAREAGCQVCVTSDIYTEHRLPWVIARPPDLAQDDTSMIAVVQHALAQIPGPSDQIVLLLQPTQPFRTPEHLRQAIALLQETEADSVVSVVEVPAVDKLCAVENGRLVVSPVERRQDAGPAYKRDGTVYAFWRRTVERRGNIYGYDVRPLIIPPDESCELDTEADWQAVERRWKERYG